jgi:hypothetical protein
VRRRTRCPSASSTRAAARPMPSVDPVMSMTAMVVILPGPADRREPGSPTLDWYAARGPANGRTIHDAGRSASLGPSGPCTETEG